MTRVIVVDDHTLVREGVRRGLERAGMEVVAEAGDGEQAVSLVLAHRPDVVLMDLSLPVLSGISATRRISRDAPDVAVLVLSMLSDEVAVGAALHAGAVGFIGKDASTAEIVAAVEAVAEGREPPPGPAQLSPNGLTKEAAELEGAAELLTRREEEVLRLLATGVSIPEAASQLYISQKTLKNHMASIYQKLHSHDRAQAVLKAIRIGLVHVE